MEVKFANQYGYSDVNPFEVIRVVSDKCLEVRAMLAVALPWEMEVYHGGFCANVANQRDQKWDIKSNAANPVIRIRLQKDGQWKNPSKGKFYLADQPRKFIDYNF